MAGSARGSSIADSSHYQGDNDAEMKNTIEEEEKKEAVYGFGNLENANSKKSGKRLPPTKIGDLEQEVTGQ